MDRQAIAYLQDEAREAARQIEDLHRALVTARRIGAAIGILMSTLKITGEHAFGLLVMSSQRLNRKLRDVADDIMFLGELPDPENSARIAVRQPRRDAPAPTV